MATHVLAADGELVNSEDDLEAVTRPHTRITRRHDRAPADSSAGSGFESLAAHNQTAGQQMIDNP
jgi:hypothetical protein